MQRRIGFLLCILISGMVSSASAEEVGPSPFPAIQRGADFCFSRQYDEKHLRRNPKQLVTSVQFMGRDAWRTHFSSDGNLDVSLRVKFRDTSKELLLNGTCWRDDEQVPIL